VTEREGPGDMSPSGGYWRMTTRYTVVISETTTRGPGYGTSAQPAHGEEAGASRIEGSTS